jgi:hypothetical protein
VFLSARGEIQAALSLRVDDGFMASGYERRCRELGRMAERFPPAVRGKRASWDDREDRGFGRSRGEGGIDAEAAALLARARGGEGGLERTDPPARFAKPPAAERGRGSPLDRDAVF